MPSCEKPAYDHALALVKDVCDALCRLFGAPHFTGFQARTYGSCHCHRIVATYQATRGLVFYFDGPDITIQGLWPVYQTVTRGPTAWGLATTDPSLTVTTNQTAQTMATQAHLSVLLPYQRLIARVETALIGARRDDRAAAFGLARQIAAALGIDTPRFSSEGYEFSILGDPTSPESASISLRDDRPGYDVSFTNLPPGDLHELLPLLRTLARR